MKPILKKAADCFKNGDYRSALNLYERAASVLGERYVAHNIEICRKKLGKTKRKAFVNEYFDNVYVVNLKHKIRDRLTVAQHLNTEGVSFEIFEAVNGYEGQPLKKWQEYLARPLGEFKRYQDEKENEILRGHPYIESAGAVGYIFTYIEILKDAKRKGYKKFLILEDDILLSNFFHERLECLIEKMDNDWKILQLGASQYGWLGIEESKALEDGFYYPRRIDSCHTCGSFAIAFDESVIEELIEAQSAFEAPFDHLPMGELYEKYLGRCYVAYPNIVMPDVAESTIRGARCQIEHSKKVKWRINDYDYPPKIPSVNVIVKNKPQLKYLSRFLNQKDRPIELRLYQETSDGFRPIHNQEAIQQECCKSKNKKLPMADYNLILKDEAILSESELVAYVEFKVGLSNDKPTSFYEYDCQFQDASNYVAERATVIIPTYKRPDNLKNALVSVVEQDYKDVEIVVVNDNGLDSPFNTETFQIVDKVRQEYRGCNIVYIEHQINRNGAAARNTGLLNSTGEYISFLDDDDIYLPGRLSKTIEKLRESPHGIGAVYCGFLGWNSPVNDPGRYAEGDLTKEILLLDYKKHYLHTNTATYKRSSVISINGFDESYRRHQDLEFNLRFFEKYLVQSVSDACVRLNPAPSGVSNKVFDEAMYDLKEKFLKQFSYIINEYGEDFSSQVYKLHWKEVLRYINDADKFRSHLSLKQEIGLYDFIQEFA
ncbi:glycosyltransferase [Halomonas sp. DWK9]|uniref:glycosyltransferase n=1 Tax=Halomonas sp. DWK9 TaxID=3060155 RepID=UPI00287FAD72|nr:glycosyltransferase [Halomonas sp. DWK9]